MVIDGAADNPSPTEVLTLPNCRFLADLQWISSSSALVTCWLNAGNVIYKYDFQGDSDTVLSFEEMYTSAQRLYAAVYDEKRDMVYSLQ
eukprot:scaffold304626_cov18-Tisochrysis_lutea.AAC.1